MTSQRKVTRKVRSERGEQRIVKEKFEESRKVSPLVAKNDFQRGVLKALKTNQVVVIEGSAGVGKTTMAMSHAGDLLVQNKLQKLILSRPAQGMGKSIGLLPGEIRAKYEPYLMPLVEVFQERHGKAKYEIALGNGELEMQPLEYIRGRNFKGIAIIDEGQNTTPDEMYSILTRLTDEGQLIILGDVTQNDIKGQNGLQWLKEFVREQGLEDVVSFHQATSEDIVRGGFCKRVVQAMETHIAEREAANCRNIKRAA